MTLDLEGLPPRLFPCTPTRLGTWLDCRRRYRFAYLDRPTPQRAGPWAHLSLGNSVHLALREWWSLPAGQRTPASAGGLVERVWLSDGFRDDVQSQRWRIEASGWVQRYVATVDATSEPLGLERTVALRTARLAFSGRVDRLDRRSDGMLAVVDYKTGRHPPNDRDARSSMALALYARATAATLRLPCLRVELHHLPTGTVAAWEHDDRSVERHLRRAEGIGAEAQAAEARASQGAPDDEVFPPSPGVLCGWCDFRAVCPEGERAAPAQPSWAGLGDDSSGFAGSTGFTVGVGPDTPGSG